MRSVFADALYWVALAHRRDQWHQAAVAAIQSRGETRIIMTEAILVEFLNAFSSGGDICTTLCCAHQWSRLPSAAKR
jgi:uncharacterized protein